MGVASKKPGSMDEILMGCDVKAGVKDSEGGSEGGRNEDGARGSLCRRWMVEPDVLNTFGV